MPNGSAQPQRCRAWVGRAAAPGVAACKHRLPGHLFDNLGTDSAAPAPAFGTLDRFRRPFIAAPSAMSQQPLCGPSSAKSTKPGNGSMSMGRGSARLWGALSARFWPKPGRFRPEHRTPARFRQSRPGVGQIWPNLSMMRRQIWAISTKSRARSGARSGARVAPDWSDFGRLRPQWGDSDRIEHAVGLVWPNFGQFWLIFGRSGPTWTRV